MRPLVLGLALASIVAPCGAWSKGDASPHGRPERDCLPWGDTLDAVASHQVVAPGRAIGSARHAEPDGDILRASLCRRGEALIYRIVLLRKDGRLVRITVDAPSGKVEAVR